MSQYDYIKDLAKLGLKNDQEGLLSVLNDLIEYSKKTKKTNFALQLQSIVKDSIREQQGKGLVRVGTPVHFLREENRDLKELIIERLTSDYRFDNLVCDSSIKEELSYFVREHKELELLQKLDLPIANKVLFYGPSGCGKTLASYVLAGELNKLMIVVNLGAIVSSKLGETSKNLAKVFRQSTKEQCILFIDEFDSLGKLRDYSQDHGEMKRVVNTILQLFDYMPQDSIFIAATNQVDMIDDALLRRFDLKLHLGLPNKSQINELIQKTLQSGKFYFDKPMKLSSIIELCLGLSYYSIQKTLINAIKRSLLSEADGVKFLKASINTNLWENLIKKERESMKKTSFS
ncbi:MAG: ATP-binding protein [Saprospiraceae bacterium]